jgi:hypothetical protein
VGLDKSKSMLSYHILDYSIYCLPRVPNILDWTLRGGDALSLHRTTAKTTYGKIFGTRVSNLLGPTNFVVGALAEMLRSPPRKNANGPEVCARGLRRDVQIRNGFSSFGHSEE